MKDIIFISFLLILYSCTVVKNKDNASIKFENIEYNFGTLPVDKEAEHIFEFINPSEMPIIISNVTTSCGCTVADWTKKPVKPQTSGEIKIKYDAGFPGVFNKTISVHFNGEDSPVTLHIKGRVEYPINLEEPKE